MQILVIIGDCIMRNSSANLCHLAYIRGLLDLGHDVSLLSADGRDYNLDESMQIPDKVNNYTYYAVTFYEKLSNVKKTKSKEKLNFSDEEKGKVISLRNKLIKNTKNFVLSCYGVHGLYYKFVKKARKFKSSVNYDCVLSISTPVSSHLLAYELINTGNIKCNKWVQIWEDPWYSDVYGFYNNRKVFKEEKRLLSFAEKVCYVSPITLLNQKHYFPEFAHKMYWQPLPYYYKENENKQNIKEELVFGYFGDYAPVARNLKPFYDAAKELNSKVNICGNPSNLFKSTKDIVIQPRMPLAELKKIEDKTSVLVFLCNIRGGQIPGKIYQYSATNKVILFILDGTDEEKKILREYFEPFNRYIFCENTVEDITRAIKLIENNDFGNVKNIPIDEFNPKITIKKILEG